MIRLPGNLPGPPFVLDREGATYILTQDIVADGTATIIKAKDAEIDLRDYAEAGIPMPVAYIPGAEPSLFLCGSTLFGLDESEYEIAGALRGAPCEVVKAETSDLLVPAAAEYVIEGEIMPGELIREGPFGEYTGHYSGKGDEGREFINRNPEQ